MTRLVRGAKCVVRGAACVVLAAAVVFGFSPIDFAVASGLSRTVSAQGTDPATAYQTHCANCHDQPTGRTPPKAALGERTPESILATITTGSMAVMAIQVSAAEKRALAEYLSGKPLTRTADPVDAGLCTARPAPIAVNSKAQWNGFGVDSSNSRYQPKPGMTVEDVPKLQLKWAFGFPGGTQAYGNPVIVGGRVFVGSDAGNVYALDAATGCTYWSFKAEGGVRAAPSIGRAGSRVALFIGDQKANAYALDANTGQVIWKKKVDPHAFARVTGAPTLHNGRLYVPVSSIEEVPAAQPKYECCTFRGSVVSLDAATGDQIWKSYTIKEQPQQTGKNSVGTPLFGPAGASVWSSPTIDEKRGALYIGTGNSYTGPAVPTSDSVMAMDLKTGKILWWNQATSADAYLVGCRPDNENCPKELGPDFDFGNSPILRTLAGGKRILVTGQKSGIAWGMDPDKEGATVWQYKAGRGGTLGGIEWGSAADDKAAYIPVSDVLAAANDAGGLFALNLETGEQIWKTPAPKLDCNSGRGCSGAQSAPVSVIPGVVFSGSVDGHMRAFSTVDGRIIWDYNTAHDYETVNHVPAKGGSIDAAGPAIADGLLITNSGYSLWKGMAGNVLLAFSAK